MKYRKAIPALLATCALMLPGSARASVPSVGYSYHAFGLAVSTQLGVLEIVREGQAAVDPSGRIVSELQTPAGFIESNVLYDSEYDDRNAAGGLTPHGTVVVFLGRYDAIRARWVDMGFVRSVDNGQTWSTYQTVPTDGDTKFSPYGPLVSLPSGRLLQTVYGTHGRVHSIRVLSSDDDGQSWTTLSTVVRTKDSIPTEAAALLVGGTHDAEAKILLIARTATRKGLSDGLRQYESSDGGATWKPRGKINISSHVGDVSPWLERKTNGDVILVWADRSPCMCLREALVKPSIVWRHAQNWPAAINFYSSKLNGIAQRDPGRFGYPSLLDNLAVFYDVGALDSGTGDEHTAARTQILSQPLPL